MLRDKPAAPPARSPGRLMHREDNAERRFLSVSLR